MPFRTRLTTPGRRPRCWLAVVGWLGLAVASHAAGAAADAAADAVEWPVQVHTVDDWPDPAALPGRAAAVSGVSLKPDVVTMGSRWYVLTLRCPDEATCQRFFDQLSVQKTLFVELKRDARVPIPTRPSRNVSQ